MAKATGGATFHVALGDIKLSSTQRKSLAQAINSATLAELAKVDLADGIVARTSPDWQGIVIDPYFAKKSLRQAAAARVPAEVTGTTMTVAIGDVGLTSAQQKTIGSAINSAAISELSRLGVRENISVRYPKEWLGIWLDRIRVNDVGGRATPVLKGGARGGR